MELFSISRRCIAEYERSLRQLAEEKARTEKSAKESVIDIISERDQAIEEISTIEKAFGDLHRRFEKSKQIIEGFKTVNPLFLMHLFAVYLDPSLFNFYFKMFAQNYA